MAAASNGKVVDSNPNGINGKAKNTVVSMKPPVKNPKKPKKSSLFSSMISLVTRYASNASIMLISICRLLTKLQDLNMVLHNHNIAAMSCNLRSHHRKLPADL